MKSSQLHIWFAGAAPLLAVPVSLHAQLNVGTGIVTGTNISSAAGEVSAMLNGVTFVNKGLVGVGRIDAAAIDGWGESLGSVSGLQVSNWTINGNGTYGGSFNFTPDRGYNSAPNFSNYAARIQKVDFSFNPYTGGATSGVAKNQFALTYDAAGSTKLTYDSGTGYVATTGLVPDSSTTIGGRLVPYVTVSNGTATFPTSGGTTINRVSLDTEGLVLKADGSGYASDEYGANIYHFNSSNQIDGVITPPAAVTPRVSGTVNFSSEVTPADGRRGNQGMEGVALSPDGTRLFGMMQSATIQDSGTGAQGRLNTRLFVYDVSAEATPSASVAEYVLKLPVFNDTGSGTPNRTAAQSEIIAINNTHILVLSRDGIGKGTSTSAVPVFKSILLIDLANATNIAGTAYDNAGGDITPSGTTLAPGITPVSYVEALNILNTAQLGIYGLNLNAGLAADANSLSEKWEGLALTPTGNADEYFLFVANDNDFISGATKMVALDGTTLTTTNALTQNGVPVQNDTMFLAYRVSISGISAIPEPSTYAAIFGAGALGLALWRRRPTVRNQKR